ncbi:MAG: glycosyltransferase, partial [Chloroflexota bacterium]
MRILMMTGSLPYPPHQGGAIRAYGMLRGLNDAGHKVTLLSFHDENQNALPQDSPLRSVCERIVTVPFPRRSTVTRLRDLILSSQADIATRLESAPMHTALRDLFSSARFDLAQFEGIEIANYLFAVQELQPGITTIYDAFNAEAALQQVIAQVDRQDLRRLPNAVYSQIQSGRIERFERAICQVASAVVAVSDEDAAILRTYRADHTVHVVPSGIFTSDYSQPSEPLDLEG